jgi:hypothetical protein
MKGWKMLQSDLGESNCDWYLMYRLPSTIVYGRQMGYIQYSEKTRISYC